ASGASTLAVRGGLVGSVPRATSSSSLASHANAQHNANGSQIRTMKAHGSTIGSFGPRSKLPVANDSRPGDGHGRERCQSRRVTCQSNEFVPARGGGVRLSYTVCIGLLLALASSGCALGPRA